MHKFNIGSSPPLKLESKLKQFCAEYTLFTPATGSKICINVKA